MKFNVQEPGEAGVLKLDGDLTVERADELKEALLEAIRSVNKVFYNVEGVTSVDLACLQLLCSAHRTAASMNKEFAEQGSRPEVFEEVIESAGFARHMGCTEQTRQNCLWRIEAGNIA
jgi:anti-anti-sigma factor